MTEAMTAEHYSALLVDAIAYQATADANAQGLEGHADGSTQLDLTMTVDQLATFVAKALDAAGAGWEHASTCQQVGGLGRSIAGRTGGRLRCTCQPRQLYRLQGLERAEARMVAAALAAADQVLEEAPVPEPATCSGCGRRIYGELVAAGRCQACG